MRTFFFNVGESTSMYANRPRSCRRNDLDVCESTCMRIDLYVKRPASIKIIIQKLNNVSVFTCYKKLKMSSKSMPVCVTKGWGLHSFVSITVVDSPQLAV